MARSKDQLQPSFAGHRRVRRRTGAACRSCGYADRRRRRSGRRALPCSSTAAHPSTAVGAGHPKRGQRQEAHLTGSANSEALLRRAPARLSSAIARCHQPVATNQRFAELPSWLSRTAWIAAAAPARPRCPTITCPASARADCVGIALVRCGGDRAHNTASEGIPRCFSNVEFTVGP